MSKKPNLAHIAEPLRHLAVAVADLTPDPANARRHDEKNLASIEASLRRFGQRQPLVVQREGMIVRAGNARLDVAKRLGWTHVAALVVDEASADAVAYAIADNRTAELAEWDDAALLAAIRSIPEIDPAEFGFTGEEIETLIGSFSASPVGLDEQSALDEPKHLLCPSCGYEWDSQA